MRTHNEVYEEGVRGWDRDDDLPGLGGPESAIVFSGGLSGALPSRNTLAPLNYDLGSPRAAWSLLEAIEHSLVRVAICDERVQAWWEREKETATNAVQRRVFSCFWETWAILGQAERPIHGYFGQIYQDADRVWQLSLNSPDEDQKASFYRTVFEADAWPAAAEVLVIHQGILDKWKGAEGNEERLSLLMMIKDVMPWLVVTSGRGRPEAVPYGVRFLPFAGLQACLVGERLDKLMLMREIMACGGQI